MHTCPICDQPVDTNTESHITGSDGKVYHHDCYSASLDVPAELPQLEE